MTAPITPEIIFAAAQKLARTHGIDRVLKRHLAEHLGCSMTLINYHIGTMAKLRQAVADWAHAKGDIDVFRGTRRRK